MRIDRELKIGDKVTRDRRIAQSSWPAGEVRTVAGFDRDGDPYMKEDVAGFGATIGWADYQELTLVEEEKCIDPISELDAIERDMTDLFARMRAAIERLA